VPVVDDLMPTRAHHPSEFPDFLSIGAGAKRLVGNRVR